MASFLRGMKHGGRVANTKSEPAHDLAVAFNKPNPAIHQNNLGARRGNTDDAAPVFRKPARIGACQDDFS